jgi:hypothetical protein
MLRTVWFDCQHAVRLYRRTPRASLFAIVVLAVGMAFVAAFLSLYVSLALRPHPGFEESSRIATLGVHIPYGAIERVAEEMTSIEALAMLYGVTTLVGPESKPTLTVLTSEGFLAGLRPRLALGRGFLAEEHAPDAEPVAVLSYRYWRERFDGDPKVLGTPLEISRDPTRSYEGPNFFPAKPERESAQFRIVGVMAESMSDTPYTDTALWVPIESAYPLFVGASEVLRITPVGRSYIRRRAGVSLQALVNEFYSRYPVLNSLMEPPP